MIQENPVNKRHFLFEILQPGVVFLTAATFFIGIGVAHYLGSSIDWLQSLFVILSATFLIWGRNALRAYYDHPESPYCILKHDHPRYSKLVATKRATMLTNALLLFTAAATFDVVAIFRQTINLAYLFLLVIVFVTFFITSAPPVFLQRKGYGELIEALNVAIFIPAIALVLNYGKLHPLLEMLTFPILFVYLAVKLAFSFRTYFEDKKGGNPNLLNQLDWSKSMKLHNILIIIAFAFVPIFTFINLPWSLAWPMLLTVPIAIFEVLQILNILNGAKPNWTIFEWAAGSLIGILCYLVLLTLWLH